VFLLVFCVSLPGRLLVYLPNVRQLGVSRRIIDADERARLKEIVEAFEAPGGWIVRTAGEGLGAADLVPKGDPYLEESLHHHQ